MSLDCQERGGQRVPTEMLIPYTAIGHPSQWLNLFQTLLQDGLQVTSSCA